TWTMRCTVCDIARINRKQRYGRHYLLEHSSTVRRRVEGRPAPGQNEPARSPNERTHIGGARPSQGLRDDRGLAENHVVHVERVTAPRVGKSDHVRASRPPL